jgi:hypothetical protein
MGIGRFLKSLVNSEIMGEEIIANQEKTYVKAEMYPDAEPHVLLAQVWLTRIAAHGKNPIDEEMQIIAFSETMQFACVPPPNNARALGLYFIYKERPDILQDYPKFGIEYESLMSPVFKAIESGNLDALYQLYNPKLASEQNNTTN